jgi:hypothetical protein
VTLRELLRRALVLRDQIVGLTCLIVLIDVCSIFALFAWIHHRNGRNAIACLCIAGTLGCAVLLSRLVRREQRDVLAAIRRTLGR